MPVSRKHTNRCPSCMGQPTCMHSEYLVLSTRMGSCRVFLCTIYNFLSIHSLIPEERFGGMNDALVGLVIGVGEEWAPAIGQSAGIHSEAMVLGGDVAAQAVFIHAWLVVATIAVPDNTSGTEETLAGWGWKSRDYE